MTTSLPQSNKSSVISVSGLFPHTLSTFELSLQGYDISFAITEDHDVLSWGGKGTGADGHRINSDFYDDDTDAYLEPKPIQDLLGEEVNQVLT